MAEKDNTELNFAIIERIYEKGRPFTIDDLPDLTVTGVTPPPVRHTTPTVEGTQLCQATGRVPILFTGDCQLIGIRQ